MLDTLGRDFRAIAPAADFCALRYMEESSEFLAVRQDVAEPPQLSTDRGAMVTVIDKGGIGYAATSDLTPAGLREAAGRAKRLAQLTAGRTVVDYSRIGMPRPKGRYEAPMADDPARLSRREKLDLLAGEAKQCRIDDRIVDWEASLWTTRTRQAYFTADGGEVEQVFHYLVPNMSATAHAGGVTQTRTHAGRGNGYCRQGGLEILDAFGLKGSGALGGRRRAGAARRAQLPQRPHGRPPHARPDDAADPRVHRPPAGARPHPGRRAQLRRHELRDPRHVRLLSLRLGAARTSPSTPRAPRSTRATAATTTASPPSASTSSARASSSARSAARVSQARAGIAGVANTRACAWNRAPIDRMANLNIEPGASTARRARSRRSSTA